MPSGIPQNCEDWKLHKLLDDEPTQTHSLVADALHVSQETIIIWVGTSNGKNQQNR